MTASELLHEMIQELDRQLRVEDDFGVYNALGAFYKLLTDLQDRLVRQAALDGAGQCIPSENIYADRLRQAEEDFAHRDKLLQDEIRGLTACLEAEKRAHLQTKATYNRMEMAFKGLKEQAASYKGLYREAEDEVAKLLDERQDLIAKLQDLIRVTDEYNEEEDWDD